MVDLQAARIPDGAAALAAQDPLDPHQAEGRGPLEAQLPASVRVPGGKVPRVRRGEPALARLEAHRQVFRVQEAVPLVAPVARHGQQPVPVRPPRREAAGLPADPPGAIGVDLVLARRPPAPDSPAEPGPAVRAHVGDAREVGRGAGLEPDRAHGERGAPAHVLGDDRPMTREAERHRRGRGAPDGDLLQHGAHRLPAVAVAVLRRLVGLGPVDVEVLLVDGEDREAEGDAVVVADGDAGQGRLPRPDHVQPGGVEVREVAQRRHALGAVRVIGEDRAARRGPPARDRPVVGADVLGPARPRGHRGQARGGLLRRELDGLRRELVDGQDVLGDVVEIEPVRHHGLPARLEPAAQRLGIAAELAQHERTGDLAVDVLCQAVAPDAHDVLGRPALRRVVERLELDGQRHDAALDELHVGVDPRREARGDGFGVGGIGVPLALDLAAGEEQARGAILLEVGRPECGREAAQSPPPPEVDLPQPVARRVEALEEERVVLALRVEVRNPPAIHEDLSRLREPRDRVGRGGRSSAARAGDCASRAEPVGRGERPSRLQQAPSSESVSHRAASPDGWTCSELARAGLRECGPGTGQCTAANDASAAAISPTSSIEPHATAITSSYAASSLGSSVIPFFERKT